jgi:hypothetical protein
VVARYFFAEALLGGRLVCPGLVRGLSLQQSYVVLFSELDDVRADEEQAFFQVSGMKIVLNLQNSAVWELGTV